MDPIITELKAVQARAWERLKVLAGLYVYYLDNRRDPYPQGRGAIYFVDLATEKEMRELRQLLNPEKDPVFVVPKGDGAIQSSVLVTVEKNRVLNQNSEMIPVQLVVPETTPIEPPAEPDDLDDPLDKLLSMGD